MTFIRPGLRNAGPLAGFLVLSFLTAQVGSAATEPALASWYPGLAKPDWTPPGWVIGAVWGVLYPMIGVAGWLIWRHARGLALGAWAVQLLLNGAWSVVFFGVHEIGGALVLIGALITMVAVTAVLSFPGSKVATTLLLPYLAWLGFAAVLNARIWALNPG